MKHETKACGRCGDLFECKVGDVVNCQCSQVQLSPETFEFLANTHFDCLCSKCLVEIDKMLKQAKEIPFPRKSHQFIEGVHYYLDGGMWVFTEFYHLSRGECCGNGCRHCAYGYKKNDSQITSEAA